VPELPEVETTARGLRASIVGRRIVGAGAMDWPAMLPNAAPEEIDRITAGRTIESVERRGKYLLVGLSDDVWLAIHRKMSGNLILHDHEVPPAPHTHFSLTLDDGRRLDFVDPRKFGRVYLFRSASELTSFLDSRLGPEPLEGLTSARLGQLMARRNGRLKSLLLDQRFLAGLGNLYADEILWVARLHPLRQGSTLTARERNYLFEAIREVLVDAIERRGTSFSSYVDAAGEPGTNQGFLRVYGRAGEPCFRCGSVIERMVIGQRGTWYCRRCQRPRSTTRGREPRSVLRQAQDERG
jgi:formamidopyrimidine-DNA glycosylase